jgi:glutamate formiminotransferase/formiminotetrahydrofolate cyclodeaminase
MAREGNPASASDAGVGALALRAAIRGAWLNVRTNATGIEDKRAIAQILAEGARLDAEAAQREGEILGIVEAKM